MKKSSQFDLEVKFKGTQEFDNSKIFNNVLEIYETDNSQAIDPMEFILKPHKGYRIVYQVHGVKMDDDMRTEYATFLSDQVLWVSVTPSILQ